MNQQGIYQNQQLYQNTGDFKNTQPVMFYQPSGQQQNMDSPFQYQNQNDQNAIVGQT